MLIWPIPCLSTTKEDLEEHSLLIGPRNIDFEDFKASNLKYD